MRLDREKSPLLVLIIIILAGVCGYLIWRLEVHTQGGSVGAPITSSQGSSDFPSAEEAFASIATSTFSNFSFEYPASASVQEFSWEGVKSPGNTVIGIPTSRTSATIFLFTTPAPLSSINPSAKTLSDYEDTYPIGATSTVQALVQGSVQTIVTQEEVRILSTEATTSNGIPMLRQRYSVGHESVDETGNPTFKDDSEAEVDNELRYVFFDGKSFVIITGWQDDSYIERIVGSIRLLN